MTLTPMGGPLWLRMTSGVESAPVHIEEHVCLGPNSVVLKGVRIGEGSVVALGAVVTKSAPSYSTVADNRGRRVKCISRGANCAEAP